MAASADGDKRDVMASRTVSQVSYTGTDSVSSPGSEMLRCAGRADVLWISADFEVTLGFVDGLDFAVDMVWSVGGGYGAERGPELRRVVLGMLEDCGIK